MRSTAPSRVTPAAGDGHSLFVSFTFESGILRVKPTGPSLSEREAMIVSREASVVLRNYDKSIRKLVLDLSDVQLISSFGLGLCIELRNLADAVNAPTIIYGLSTELMELFRMMRVDRLYTVANSPNELAKALESP